MLAAGRPDILARRLGRGFVQARCAFAIGLGLLSMTICGSGCGDDDNATTAATLGKNCGTFHACGGDPIGSWSLQDLCYDQDLKQAAIDQFGPDCADEVQSYAFHGALTVTFDKSTFRSELGDLWAEESLRITQKCLDAIARSTGSNQTIPLEQYCPKLEARYNQGGIDASCGLSGGACSCDLTIQTASDNHTATGQYSQMGNSLILDGSLLMGDLATGGGAIGDAGAGVDPNAHPFCVENDRLSLSFEIPDGPGLTFAFGRK
jgi:hypothetical protein